jgi:hypothetical protein
MRRCQASAAGQGFRGKKILCIPDITALYAIPDRDAEEPEFEPQGCFFLYGHLEGMAAGALFFQAPSVRGTFFRAFGKDPSCNSSAFVGMRTVDEDAEVTVCAENTRKAVPFYYRIHSFGFKPIPEQGGFVFVKVFRYHRG